MIILPPSLLAEVPADAVVWIVIGIVWAIAQVFTKMARRATTADTPEKQGTSPDRQRRSTRPTATHDPVSPNDELRRFLREISGDADSEAPLPTVSPPATRSTPAPRPRRSTMPPVKTTTGTADRAPDIKPTAPRPTRRRNATPPKPKPRVPTPSPREATPVPGLGNWRAAVIHREILGPPRALRAYSSSEF